MFKGPKGSSSGRTPRTQAESIGTEAAGFEKLDANYDAKAGHPTGKGMPPAQEYKPREIPNPKESGGKNFDPKPFTTSNKE